MKVDFKHTVPPTIESVLALDWGEYIPIVAKHGNVYRVRVQKGGEHYSQAVRKDELHNINSVAPLFYEWWLELKTEESQSEHS